MRDGGPAPYSPPLAESAAPADGRWRLAAPADGQQIFTPNVQPGRDGVEPMIAVDVAFEVLPAIRRKTLSELAQRAKAARVPFPDIVGAAMVGITDPTLIFQIKGAAEQFLNVRRIAPSQR